MSYVILTAPGAYIVDVRDVSTTGSRIQPTPSVIQVPTFLLCAFVCQKHNNNKLKLANAKVTLPTSDEKMAAFSATNSRVDISPLMIPAAVDGRSSLFTILAFNAAGVLMHTGGMTFDAVSRVVRSRRRRLSNARRALASSTTSTARTLVTSFRLQVHFVLRISIAFGQTLSLQSGNGTHQLDVRAVGTSVSIAPTPTTIEVQASPTGLLLLLLDMQVSRLCFWIEFVCVRVSN